MTKKTFSFGLAALTAVSLSIASGCSRPQPMAPPVTAPVSQAPPMNPAPAGAPAAAPTGDVYSWKDVPVNQEVPITRGVFDQGGYQLFAATGETIVVPFVNQNLYAMKFGLSNRGSMYFVQDGNAPTLYVPRGGFLENAANANARWYPFSQNFQYSRPVYIGLAPTWSDYVAMGWYPGMTYYGGYWGYNPWVVGYAYRPMIGLNINIGGNRYSDWGGYRGYYTRNTANRVNWGRSPAYSTVSRGRSGSFGSGGRSTGTGSFGRSSSSGGFGRSSGNSSFGRSASGSSGSFGRTPPGPGGSSFGRSSTGSGNSFGTSTNRPSGSGSFGGSSSGSSGFGRSSGSSGSFGSGSSSFGSSSRPRSSFGSGSSGFGSSSGSSGFGRSSGSSFGSSSGSSGSSSFGRSSGSSSFGRSSGSSSFGRSGGGRRR